MRIPQDVFVYKAETFDFKLHDRLERDKQMGNIVVFAPYPFISFQTWAHVFQAGLRLTA